MPTYSYLAENYPINKIELEEKMIEHEKKINL